MCHTCIYTCICDTVAGVAPLSSACLLYLKYTCHCMYVCTHVFVTQSLAFRYFCLAAVSQIHVSLHVCRSFSAKEPLIIGLFCREWPIKIRATVSQIHVALHVWHIYTCTDIQIYICICVCVWERESVSTAIENQWTVALGIATGWRRLNGCLKLQVIFRKRATNYRALLQKMTHKDKAFYDSTLPWIVRSRIDKTQSCRLNGNRNPRWSL